MIKFFDALKQDEPFADEIKNAVLSVISSNQFVDGEQTRLFEQNYAEENNVRYCATTSSGTSALEIMFRALNLHNGKNILCPTNSFLATASSIANVGSNPIFCDSGDDFLLDLNKVEERFKKWDIDALLLVNLYGNIAKLNTLQELCIKYGVKFLIDGAQNAFGKYYGKSPAAYCIAEATSFYVTKTLGSYSECGAILTNSKEVYEFAKSYRNHGRSIQGYTHDTLGTNARATEFDCCILNVKLKHKSWYIKQRIATANQYNNIFVNHKEILTKWNHSNSKIVPYVFPIRVKKRNELKEFLAANNIPTIVHYNPIISLQPCFKYLDHTKEDFPNAYKQSQEVLSLPFYTSIPTEHVNEIGNKVLEFLNYE